MVKIEFKTDDAAFVNDPQGEFGRIMQQAQAALDEGVLGKALMDSNGHKIGTYQVWFESSKET